MFYDYQITELRCSRITDSTSEISKWNSKVFPGSSLEALFHTRCISIFERSLCW